MKLVHDTINLTEEQIYQRIKKTNVKVQLGCQVQWLLKLINVNETYMGIVALQKCYTSSIIKIGESTRKMYTKLIYIFM